MLSIFLGNSCRFLTTGKQRWRIEPQVLLDHGHGVEIASRADFVFWPLTAGEEQQDPSVAGPLHATMTIVAHDDDAGLNHAKRVYRMLLSRSSRLWERVHVVLPPHGSNDVAEALAMLEAR